MDQEKRDKLRSHLAGVHGEHPQRAYLANAAFDSILAGVDELAKLGHRFELVAFEASPPQEWPKMYYHDALAPSGFTVDSEDEVPSGPGWRTTPLSAPVAETPPSPPLARSVPREAP
jgi:hypothetical protein